ncbi:MAG: ATP-binding protein [Aulosira sp. DedQUE10]|nr:ATP-binding protein [Aulosira sp. DedQUE10]
MSTSNSFPRSLLLQPQENRLGYFLSYTVAHPRLIEATDMVLRTIDEPAGASFIFVYGPSGIGKTTMLQKVKQTLISQALPTLETDRGCIPVASIEAIGTESANFNWKDYFTRSLITMEEPLIEHKVNYGAKGIHRNIEGHLIIEPKVAAPELRRALENALKYRRPKAFLIDEAQHMQKMASGRRLQDNMDCLKSLANLTGVIHVLFGTYELLTFRNLSAQLSRRTVDIHFPRYQTNVSEDIDIFKSILWSFQQHIPLHEEPDLLTNWEYCYVGSLGCVGILKNWLLRSFKDVLAEGGNTLSLKHLEQRNMSVAQLQTMLKEIQEGEKQLKESAENYKQLYNALGFEGESPIHSNYCFSDKPNQPKEEIPNPSKRKQSVGKRNPKRDQVGGINYNAN